MKLEKVFCYSLILLVILLLFGEIEKIQAQIIIHSDDFPSVVGTYFITEDDTVDTVNVDVGLPGENQIWKLDYPYPSEFARQLIVEKITAPFHSDFPGANMVTRYTGKMGQIIHSYYFDDTQGLFYTYQKKTPDSLSVLGIGIDSAIVNFNIFTFGYSGAVDIEPDLLFSTFPLQYGDNWKSVSQFTVEVDTLLFGTQVTLTADVRDSIYCTVDGWGVLILPAASFECLRLKSYITLNENLYINGELFKSRPSRTINYYWLAKDYGVVAKIISRHNQTDDNFTTAKQVSRLYRFNPQIQLSMPDRIAAPKDTLMLPIYTTDLNALNISAIQMQLLCNTTILKPVDIVTSGSMTEAWNNWSYTLSDSGIKLDLSGETPLEGSGILCFVRFLVSQNAQENDATFITFKYVAVHESGPIMVTKPGLVKVTPVFDITGKLSYYSNDYPIPNVQISLNENYATSGLDGKFLFNHVPKGDYDLIPLKRGAVNNCIGPFDASLILRHVVGLIALTPYQMIAADVTGNRSISTLDASFILRFSIGLIDSFPIGAEWAFIPNQFLIDNKNWPSAPQQIIYRPLDSHQADQNFKGIIYGDVSGNWMPGNHYFISALKPFSGEANVQFGEPDLSSEHEFLVPLEISAHSEILSASFQISFNSKLVSFRGLSFNEVKSNCIIEYNEHQGILDLALASSLPIRFHENAIGLKFERVKSDFDNQITINLDEVKLNENMVKVTIIKSQVSIKSNPPMFFMLNQNYPNPFNASTTFRFIIPEKGHVTLKVFDTLGREINKIFDDYKPAGEHEIRWNAQHLSSGLYFYQLQSGKFEQRKKMLVIK